ncbi:hypothetical protein EBU94_07435 [bacterium]|nr:hypothetical protein [bacterium]
MNKKEEALDSSIVYIYDERCFGNLISYGAYASRINYKKKGIEYTVDLFNDEFEIVGDIGIHYIEEDL